MPKRKYAKVIDNASDDEVYSGNDDDYDDCALPQSDNSDVEGCTDSESSDEGEPRSMNISYNTSYQNVAQNYTSKQKKLEENHVYSWVEGEKIYDTKFLENDISNLREVTRQQICQYTPVQLFELFFTNDIKKHIIDATSENDLDLSLQELNGFIGIILISSYNIRKNQREYWSKDPFLKCEAISSVMSRDKFECIKSNIKYWTTTDQNARDPNDKAWRVRTIIDLFRKNIQQFGMFSTALSVDEMMVRFFGRTTLKQYIPNKPDKFGLKFWALCSSDGYLFDLDIYCGKNAKEGEGKLSSCALGSRVVLQMVSNLLLVTNIRKLDQYHLYMDNYFTSPDLFVHLKRIGLKATGTLRKNRIKEQHKIDKKSPRGSHQVHHDENSGLNYISVLDSKQVSLLSTGAGVTPKSTVKRYSAKAHDQVEVKFPLAFSIYNKFMGGVDLHDFRCKKVAHCIKSKKWTWSVFTRLLQSSLVNATVLWNICQGKTRDKMTTRDLCIAVSKIYCENSKSPDCPAQEPHKSISKDRQACSAPKCSLRTTRYCVACTKYYCINCFKRVHEVNSKE